MANASNGEPSKKEVCVNFQQGSGNDADQVEISIHSPNKMHKRKKRGHSFLPKPFERSDGSLLNPQFDSAILEKYLVKCYFPQTRRMFRNMVIYIALASLCWALFFSLVNIEYPIDHWQYFFGGAAVMLVIMVLFILFVRSKLFEKHWKIASIALAILLVVSIQLPFIFEAPAVSPVATFFAVVEIIILLYTFFPLRIFVAFGLGVFLSISYEVFTALRFDEMQYTTLIIGKILLHLILHIIGIFFCIMTNTRMRSNFSKIGQSVSAQRELNVEREIKEKMIHSLMPPVVAKSVMASHPSKEEEESAKPESSKKSSSQAKGEIIFRNFQMDEMTNVSILFADIVGFTKMSSNKTAERLVGLLNDLFGRFDKLCNASGCEKISTLGDCYYCVSGCPNPCPEHAKCCVEMGLSMVIAIQAFDEDHNEEVNMRVGVHTGTVLCGIVGTKRFKFDVWSNDVTLANTMESSGEPGTVHISESTRAFLVDGYDMDEGEEVADMRGRKELIEHYDPEQSSFTIKHREETRNIKTFFIRGRKPGNDGIPGLEQLALERPDHMKRHLKDGKEGAATDSPRIPRAGEEEASKTVLVNAEGENGSSTAVADMFSQRLPERMTADEDDETRGGAGDDQETFGADSTLLGRSEATIEDQDRLLISLIEQEDQSHTKFFKPDINKIWLTFQPKMEAIYRYKFKDSHMFQENMLSSPRYQMVLEACLALVVLLILVVCCHIVFDATRTTALIVVTVLGLLVQTLVVVDAVSNIVCLEAKKRYPTLMMVTMNWYFRNALGVILATIPAALVYVNMSCDLATSPLWHDRFFCFALAIALLQYCNYTMLRSMIKTAVAILVGAVLIVLMFIQLCSYPYKDYSHLFSTPPPQASSNATSNCTAAGNCPYNTIKPLSIAGFTDDQLFSGQHVLRFEVILNTLLLLLLIVILNYEFENDYRLSFNATEKASKDKETMQLNKDQADWLLHNIIPDHLAELFKTNRSYSRNHQDVGVIFATIVNFNEFYDEMYEGGREYLRVLNELVGDYEVMLNEFRFKDVEKIKTISATFMAAAGLNEESRAQNKHKHAHLFALMDFATELQNVVDRFNESIFNFNFVLNIGYNYGPVTAGVIGTTKLLYDIWGDTVNIASRMYSTGEADRIQVPQATADLLSEMFEFSYRDEIAVKGKGMMKTYLLESKKDSAHWE